MTERSRNIAVGITTIVGLIGFVVLLTLFGWVPQWLEDGYTVKVQMPTASGLTAGSRVRIAGMDIGRVERVELMEPPSSGVVVSAQVRRDIRIPRDARVQVETQLLGGSPALSFDVSELDPSREVVYLPQDGSAVVEGEVHTLAGQFAGEMQAALAEPTRQFQRVANSFQQLSSEWTEVGRRLSAMLEQRSLEQVDAGEAQPNLATVLARTDQRLVELQKTLAGIDSLVNDQAFREELRAVVTNAREATESLAATAKSFQSLAGDADENLDALTKRYVALADDVSGAIGSMRDVLDRVKAGQGTIGKLVTDPSLYNNLDDAIKRLNAALEEYKQLAEKFQKEGLPVKF